MYVNIVKILTRPVHIFVLHLRGVSIDRSVNVLSSSRKVSCELNPWKSFVFNFSIFLSFINGWMDEWMNEFLLCLLLPSTIRSFLRCFFVYFFNISQLHRRWLCDIIYCSMHRPIRLFFLSKTGQRTSLNRTLNMSFSRSRILFQWTLNDYRAAIQITFRMKIAWLNQKIHFRKSGSSQIYFTLPLFSFYNFARWNSSNTGNVTFFMPV